MTRLVSTLALCTLVGAACGAPAPEAVYDRNELLVRTLMAGRESADTAMILDLFWPEATYDDFADQVTYEGLDEIVEYVSAVHAWADDVYMNVGRVHPTPSGAVAEWVFAAVQSRPMGDLVPLATGREVITNGVTIIEIDGDRIIRAADYRDTAPLMLQLGGRIVLPGGRFLEMEDLR